MSDTRPFNIFDTDPSMTPRPVCIWVTDAKSEADALRQFVEEHPILSAIYLANGARLYALR